MIKRTLFYCYMMLLKQIVKYDNYSFYNKIITINFADFNFIITLTLVVLEEGIIKVAINILDLEDDETSAKKLV